ncbi:hypothetical protein LNKW23_18990 [Paralimibaculum aggregatum]|uniref:histidine kinase n=1 Tax=Paralimibaculum aggregatum TaxID=3036245 RepID=A0ABQ6LQ27_9RHOB|nr:response regulator [Limibaculum sp. NKW23]GMG82686.1 hypothetical protein LNKW23_18990 [Limibaculum sp. NKW23]
MSAAVQGPRVLVVDDDIDFAGSLTALLQLEGHGVAVAHSPEAALARIEADGIVVALVDIRLGRQSGVELVREMRRRRPEMVCVMITAYASIDTAVEALQAGAYDYLCKPFYPEDLIATLGRCFERLELGAERRRIAERVSHMQRMETIGQMTSGIAHDFHNVIGVQFATLRWLEGRMPPGSAEAEAIADAIASLEGGQRLTSRLLHFGRTGRGDTEIVDLAAEMPPIARVLRRALGESVEVVLEIAPALHPVSVARGELEAIFLNLALNARDAMPEGGCLRIALANMRVTREPAWRRLGLIAGEHLRIAVSDTGTGMTPEVLARALEPLYSTKPRERGCGLGLSMVDNFIRQAGGRVVIESAPGAGTRVELYLPRAVPSSPPSSPGCATNM